VENSSNPGGSVVNQFAAIPADQSVTNSQSIPVQTPSPAPLVDPLFTTKMEAEDLSEKWIRWKCLVCGFVYEGRNELRKCPKCGNEDPDKFDDAD
jgi:rubredoxin